MLRLYFDHNVHEIASRVLRERQLDVLTALEDGCHDIPDDRLLERASELGRALVTHDRDFLREAKRRQRLRLPFAGVIYCHQNRLTLAQLVDELELVARGSTDDELRDRVLFVPV